jgi:TetR/AcrR family transcriptional regulator, cholesterol catabolism regulator
MEEPVSAARERVYQVAERLFSEYGYAAVSLHDIATAVGMRKASLYNHAPGGKAELFVAVIKRGLARHRHGITEAAQAAPQELRAQLRAMAHWLLSQPPLNLQRLHASDLPAISANDAKVIRQLSYDSLIAPIEQVVRAAAQRGEANDTFAGMVAGTFLVVVESFHDIEQYGVSKNELADQLISVLVDGIAYH